MPDSTGRPTYIELLKRVLDPIEDEMLETATTLLKGDLGAPSLDNYDEVLDKIVKLGDKVRTQIEESIVENRLADLVGEPGSTEAVESTQAVKSELDLDVEDEMEDYFLHLVQRPSVKRFDAASAPIYFKLLHGFSAESMGSFADSVFGWTIEKFTLEEFLEITSKWHPFSRFDDNGTSIAAVEERAIPQWFGQLVSSAVRPSNGWMGDRKQPLPEEIVSQIMDAGMRPLRFAVLIFCDEATELGELEGLPLSDVLSAVVRHRRENDGVFPSSEDHAIELRLVFHEIPPKRYAHGVFPRRLREEAS